MKMLYMCSRLEQSQSDILRAKKQAFALLLEQLEAFNPLGVLRRGYSLLEKNEKAPDGFVTSVKSMKEGSRYRIWLSDGTARFTANDIEIEGMNYGKKE